MNILIRWVTFYAESLTGGLFLWLGLYILSRGFPLDRGAEKRRWWRHGTFAAGLSFVLTAWFIFGIALRSIVVDQDVVTLNLVVSAAGFGVVVASCMAYSGEG